MFKTNKIIWLSLLALAVFFLLVFYSAKILKEPNNTAPSDFISIIESEPAYSEPAQTIKQIPTPTIKKTTDYNLKQKREKHPPNNNRKSSWLETINIDRSPDQPATVPSIEMESSELQILLKNLKQTSPKTPKNTADHLDPRLEPDEYSLGLSTQPPSVMLEPESLESLDIDINSILIENVITEPNNDLLEPVGDLEANRERYNMEQELPPSPANIEIEPFN